ncbi:MAG: NAD(P)/FAD-dependent oxidoreductase [Pyrinomonadaceae bacterium]
MPTITVVGAGFSGLATAYFLTKNGLEVRLVEKTDRAGGLIKTIRTKHGMVETAANGLFSSARLEAMCAEINVPLIAARREARRRFIYRGKPKQLPLTAGELFVAAGRFTASAAKLRPRPFETVFGWGRRVLGRGGTDYLLLPALSGIYAGDPNRLSASLIFGKAKQPDHLHTNPPVKGRLRGTVSTSDGMQQLIDGLCDYLKRTGVEFLFNHADKTNADGPMVVCLPAGAAAQYLSEIAPQVSAALRKIEMLSLTTATCFYGPDAAKLNGFGCLFPPDQGFRARGVLFNDSIFAGRGPAHSETWIFGGALDPDVVNLSDTALAEVIAAERERFYRARDESLYMRITRWPNALPHYSIELEKVLTTLPAPPKNVALVGNYLGRIGLAKILERAAVVAEEVRRACQSGRASR